VELPDFNKSCLPRSSGAGGGSQYSARIKIHWASLMGRNDSKMGRRAGGFMVLRKEFHHPCRRLDSRAHAIGASLVGPERIHFSKPSARAGPQGL